METSTPKEVSKAIGDAIEDSPDAAELRLLYPGLQIGVLVGIHEQLYRIADALEAHTPPKVEIKRMDNAS